MSFGKRLTAPDTVRFILIVGTLTLNALFGVGLFFVHYPPENRDLVNMFMTALVGWNSMVIAYHFSKSAEVHNNEQAKSERLIDDMNATVTPDTPLEELDYEPKP